MGEKIDIQEALNEKDGFQIWWRMLRPHTLTASFIPVFIGTVYAYLYGSHHILLFLAMLIASILIQSATNMFNEYYDYKRGLDNEQSVGIGGTIVRDGVKPKVVLRLALLFYLVAAVLGLYICLQTNLWIAIIGAICMLFGYLYTGGPIPIAYTPFGELFAGFFMGTVIIAISYYIQTLTLTPDVILLSLPVAIFIGAILLANNIRDLDGDQANGRRTIAILLGRRRAISFLAILFLIAYIISSYLIAIKVLPLLSLIVFASIPKAYQVIQDFQGKTKPIEMLPAMIATGKTNTMYGILLTLSLLMSKFI